MRVGRFGNEFHIQIYHAFHKLNKALDYSDKENVVSIEEYIRSFRETYLTFKKEYDKLEDLNVGRIKNVMTYSSEDSRSVRIQLGPNEDENSEYTYLDIIEEDGRVWANLITKYGYAGKIMRLSVDEDTLREYLNLFYKYRPLFELYIHQTSEYAEPICERTKILNGARSSLTMRFNSPDDSLFEGLESVEINGAICQISDANVNFRILVDLRNGFNIDYDDILNNYVKVDGKKIKYDGYVDGSKKQNGGWINDVISEIQINNRYLGNNDIIEYSEGDRAICLIKIAQNK